MLADAAKAQPGGMIWFQPSEDRKSLDPDDPKRAAAESALARAAAQDARPGGSDERYNAFGRSAAAGMTEV